MVLVGNDRATVGFVPFSIRIVDTSKFLLRFFFSYRWSVILSYFHPLGSLQVEDVGVPDTTESYKLFCQVRN